MREKQSASVPPYDRSRLLEVTANQVHSDSTSSGSDNAVGTTAFSIANQRLEFRLTPAYSENNLGRTFIGAPINQSMLIRGGTFQAASSTIDRQTTSGAGQSGLDAAKVGKARIVHRHPPGCTSYDAQLPSSAVWSGRVLVRNPLFLASRPDQTPSPSLFLSFALSFSPRAALAASPQVRPAKPTAARVGANFAAEFLRGSCFSCRAA